MISRRSSLDRKMDRSLALMLGLLVLSRTGDPLLIQGYMMTLTSRAMSGAKMGDG